MDRKTQKRLFLPTNIAPFQEVIKKNKCKHKKYISNINSIFRLRPRPLFRLSDFEAEDYFFTDGLRADENGLPHGQGHVVFHLEREEEGEEACVAGECALPIAR